jgi:uncharacterized protein YggU (UPF0235/DUF167 family)
MRIFVKVHPNSKNPRIEKDSSDVLQIYVRELALEGKANMAAIEGLVKYFKVKKSQIMLIKGTKSKEKIFEIMG